MKTFIISLFLSFAFLNFATALPSACTEQENVISVDQLNEVGMLYASASPLPQDTEVPTVTVAEETSSFFSAFSTESLLSFILLIITTVFGAIWKKAKVKLSDALSLISTLVTALEDDKLSATEITNLKQRYYILIGKSTATD